MCLSAATFASLSSFKGHGFAVLRRSWALCRVMTKDTQGQECRRCSGWSTGQAHSSLNLPFWNDSLLKRSGLAQLQCTLDMPFRFHLIYQPQEVGGGWWECCVEKDSEPESGLMVLD